MAQEKEKKKVYRKILQRTLPRHDTKRREKEKKLKKKNHIKI